MMEHLLADEEDWAAILEPTLRQDATAVECLSRLLFRIKRAIDSGPEGAMRASRALLDGIELLYLYTNPHKAAVRLYVLSLEGNLQPQEEPLNLVNAALERGKSRAR
jgi:phage-related baseplate assembly protein